MYPPRKDDDLGRYSGLPTERPRDDHDSACTQPYDGPYSSSLSLRAKLSSLTRRRRRTRPTTIVLLLIFVVLLCIFLNNISLQNDSDESVVWNEGDFTFKDQSRPAYLDKPLSTPLRIRLAVMSRVDEFERRQVTRDAVLYGVPESDVKLEYKFFVGRRVAKDNLDTVKGWLGKIRLLMESWMYGDIIMLHDLNDVPQRLSEKRYAAIQWTASVPQSEYDYSMTMDSDTFCRFQTLARRLRHAYPELRPHMEPILIGRMGGHLVYLQNTVPDGNVNDSDEDFILKGPWYSYPLGIGYMLSSNLTETIFTADPPFPHHINYPSDDVMIGSWIAALKLFHDPNILFETTVEHSPPPQHRVYPKPYLPYAVDTKVVDDTVGWHDFKNRGGNEGPIGWETACVHRLSPNEMKDLRQMAEIRMEWDPSWALGHKEPRGFFGRLGNKTIDYIS